MLSRITPSHWDVQAVGSISLASTTVQSVSKTDRQGGECGRLHCANPSGTPGPSRARTQNPSWNDNPAVRGPGSIHLQGCHRPHSLRGHVVSVCRTVCLAWQTGRWTPCSNRGGTRKFPPAPKKGIVDGDVGCDSPTHRSPSATSSRARVLAVQLRSCPT